MGLRPLLAPCATFLALAATTPSSAAQASGVGPGPLTLNSGIIWEHADPASPALLPAAVVFAADGELVWSSSVGQQAARLALHGGRAEIQSDGSQAPLLAGFEYPSAGDPTSPGAVLDLQVAAGGAHELLALVVRAGGTPGESEVRLERRAARDANPTGWPVVWETALPWSSLGGARMALARDSSVLVAARHDPAIGRALVCWVDRASGALLRSAEFDGGALRALEISDDGSRVLIAAGAELRIFDADGVERLARTLPQAPADASLSADGSTFALGSFGNCEVWRELPQGFEEFVSFAAAPLEIATRVDLDRDGATLCVAWWDAISGRSVRLTSHDAVAATSNELFVSADATSLWQQYPADLEIARDGSRVALALWGFGDQRHEVHLLSTADGSALLEVDLVGSALALAFGGDDGQGAATQLAIAAKDAHANQFGSTGRILLAATGERDLELSRTPQLGATLRVEHAAADAWAGVLLLGTPLSEPLAWSGVSGGLRLDPTVALTALALIPDANGRLACDLSVPPMPAVIGIELGLQAVALGPDGLEFSSARATPPIL